ncbi:uncharacterized protein isoform X2 [Rhodnius prolixus]|uniref:uncharacterized protein isoform X2 n=2 Tax=Rhodnius prolixus TaxID=13249 RepID=UPI003D18F8F0
MSNAVKEKLSEYESMRQRNFDNNREFLRYLNMQEVVDLSSEGSLTELGAEGDNQKPKKRYRKSPLPPTRLRESSRLRERQKRKQEGQSTDPIIPPDYYDQFQLPSRKINTRNNNPSPIRDSSSPRQDHHHHFLHRQNRENVRDITNPNSDESVQLIGKKYVIITFLLLLIATSEWYKSSECCRRTVSRMIFYGVVIVLAVNLINMIFFSKKKR